MKVSEAIDTRFSVRAFLDKPVSERVIRDILDVARRAPSGGNLQPWHVYVLGGEKLTELVERIRKKLPSQPRGEGTEYNIYPPSLKEPYRSRRFKVGEDMYALLGIPRDAKGERLLWFARNYAFFGAPVALFFAIDRDMQEGQWADLGMFMQNVMLLAREHGLHTCPQEAWAVWYKSVGEFFDIPPHLMLFCGMALGYADEAAPVNHLRTERASPEEFAHFHGF